MPPAFHKEIADPPRRITRVASRNAPTSDDVATAAHSGSEIARCVEAFRRRED